MLSYKTALAATLIAGVALLAPGLSVAQGLASTELAPGSTAALHGLSDNGRRLVTVERGPRCWVLRSLARTDEGWDATGELVIGGTAGCPPVTPVVAAGGGTALVYDYQAAKAVVVDLASGRPVKGGELVITEEASFPIAPPGGAALTPQGDVAALGSVNRACKYGVPQRRCGVAQLFAREGAGWRFLRSIELPEGGPNNILFGQSIALSQGAQVVAIGGPGHGGDSGEVYLFERRGGDWVEVGVLVPDGRDAVFGSEVSMTPDGRAIAVAADAAVYVFTRDAQGWALAGRIDSPTPAAGTFGSSLALSADGRRILVGAPRTACGPLPRCGAAFLFERTAIGGFTNIARVEPSTPRPALDFGWRVGLDGTGNIGLVQSDRPVITQLQ